jgi:hypothetical protein
VSQYKTFLAAALLTGSAFGLAGTPAGAATLKDQGVACVQLSAAGRASDAVDICLAAAIGYRRQAEAATVNPFDDYFTQARMLATAAGDYAALKRHSDSLSTALRAHQLILWVYRSFPMDSSDRAEITNLTQQLQHLELVEGGQRA